MNHREIRKRPTPTNGTMYAMLSIVTDSEGRVVVRAFTAQHIYDTVEVQYLKRFKELIIAADDDSTPVDSSAIADFMRFLDSPVALRVRRGMVGASPTGGLTVDWGNSEHRLSIKFTGGGNALVVKIAPENPTTLDTVDCKNELEHVLSDCKWIGSETNITSASTPAVADWMATPSPQVSSRLSIGPPIGWSFIPVQKNSKLIGFGKT